MPAHRKPSKVLEFTGAFAHDPQRRAARAGEPTKNGPLGGPPPRLNAALRELWVEIAAELVPGVALRSDRRSFEGMVRLQFKMQENEITGPELAQLRMLWALFGMTPSDRSRVSVPKGKDDPANPFKKLG
jgi:hypothetical protein